MNRRPAESSRGKSKTAFAKRGLVRQIFTSTNATIEPGVVATTRQLQIPGKSPGLNRRHLSLLHPCCYLALVEIMVFNYSRIRTACFRSRVACPSYSRYLYITPTPFTHRYVTLLKCMCGFFRCTKSSISVSFACINYSLRLYRPNITSKRSHVTNGENLPSSSVSQASIRVIGYGYVDAIIRVSCVVGNLQVTYPVFI